MRRLLPASLLTALLTLCVAAHAAARAGDDKKQEKHPDFSGTWTIDRSKSDFGVFSDRPIGRAEMTLAVVHHETELKITRTVKVNGQEETRSLAYYTDGRGETNPGLFGVAEVKSKTEWEGARVVARAKLPRKGAHGDADLELTEKWALSGDGKTLTYTSLLRGEFGESMVRLVYRRGA
jgi:hypothetical protein